MYRILILFFLAIGFAAFAVDSSQSVLQAKKIRETSLVVSWSSIPEAKKYKVFYDEDALVDQKNPTPLLTTDFTDKQEIEITKLNSWTAYYVVVKGYDKNGKDLNKNSLPLHVSTFKPVLMAVSWDPFAVDDHTISIAFTRPIDVAKTEIKILNTQTKKERTLDKLEVAKDDLRVLHILLKGKMEPGVLHDIVIKKAFAQGGIELPAENKLPFTVAYSSATTPVTPKNPEEPSVSAPEDIEKLPQDAIITSVDYTKEVLTDDSKEKLDLPVLTPITDKTEKTFNKPVQIDRLPQTGPVMIILFMVSLITISLIKKLSTKREL